MHIQVCIALHVCIQIERKVSWNINKSLHTQDGGTTASEGLQMTVERVGNLFGITLNTSGNESIQLTLIGSNVCKLTMCSYVIITDLTAVYTDLNRSVLKTFN